MKIHSPLPFARRLFLLLALAPLSTLVAAEPPTAPLAFTASTNGEFTFHTGVLRGKLRAERRSFGLTSVTHQPTGQSLSRSVGLFGLYRVFSDGKRYGTAGWDWPSQATLAQDGSVDVRCPAETGRPFALRGLYRWSGPAILDLEIEVTPQQDLHSFEVFLASYFESAFSNALVQVQADPRAAGPSAFLAAEKSLGDWLMFPRDAAAVPLIQDGRWDLPPNPVGWEILSKLARPLALRRAPTSGLTALLMAPERDCFAVAMPHQTEGHYSTYLSLFGRDLPAGIVARARARLQFLESPSDEVILQTYRSYIEKTGARLQ